MIHIVDASMTIVSHDRNPRIAGYDVTVIDVYRAHSRDGLEPAEVADTLDVPLARVHEALAFYYDHVERMRRLTNDRIVEETPDPDPNNDDLFFADDNDAESGDIDTASSGRDDWNGTTPTDAGESLFGDFDGSD